MLITIAFFALNGCVQTSSRLTWSFARDDALVFSRFITRIHPKLGVPVWALIFNQFVVFIIGCVYLGSTTGKFPPLYIPMLITSSPPLNKMYPHR